MRTDYATTFGLVKISEYCDVVETRKLGVVVHCPYPCKTSMRLDGVLLGSIRQQTSDRKLEVAIHCPVCREGIASFYSES